MMLSDTARAMFRLSMDDATDPWGDTMLAHFGIAAVLTNAGEDIPSAWHYQPSPLGVSSELESWPASEWNEEYEAGTITADELRYVGNVLAKYAKVLVLAGRDY